MSIARSALQSVLWNHVGKVLEYVLMYVLAVIVARSLGVSENGAYASLVSLSQLLLTLSSFGLEASLNKHIPQLEGPDRSAQAGQILRRMIILRFVLFAAIALSILVVVPLLPFRISTRWDQYLLLLLAYSGLRAIVPLFAIVLTAQFRTALTSKINLAVRLLELVGVLVLSWRGISVGSLLALFVVTGAIQVTAYVLCSGLDDERPQEEIKTRPILTFAGIFWANAIVDYFLGRHGDILFLSTLRADSSQASLYDIAYAVVQVGSLAFTMGFAGVSFATFAKLVLRGKGQMVEFYSFLVRMISLLTIPVYTFLLFNARAIVGAFYTQEFVAASTLIQGMAIFRIASRLFAGGENAEYLLSVGKVVSLVCIGIVTGLSNVMLDLALIPQYGAIGAVAASGVANFAVNVLGWFLVFRDSGARLQVPYWFQLWAPLALVSLACSRIEFRSSGASLLVRCSAYAILLVGTLGIVKPLRNEDLGHFEKANRFLFAIARYFARTSGALGMNSSTQW